MSRDKVSTKLAGIPGITTYHLGMEADKTITSTQNPEVKLAIRLRKRSQRAEAGKMLVEGYRECLRALENGWKPEVLYFCPDCFLGKNEGTVIEKARTAGAVITACSQAPFEKMAYRERPEGLLAIGPELNHTLQNLTLSNVPLLLIAEAIEKPGNLGTILRSADAAGADAVIVCDPCTDVFNPNVVRASIGTLFTVPTVQTTTEEALAWLREKNIRTVAATPHTENLYTEADLSGPVAIIMGTEQYGLSETWLKEADLPVRIPMQGQADSLNVAAATTILLFEAVRQRMAGN